MKEKDDNFFNNKELAVIFLLQGQKILSNAKKYRKLLNALLNVKYEVKDCNHFIFYVQERIDEIRTNVPSAAKEVDKLKDR